MADKTLIEKLHELANGWHDRVDVDPADPYTEGESLALFECAQSLTAALTAQAPSEAVAWADDLRAVLAAAEDASAVPLTWLANTDFTPEQTKDWLANAVDANVEADDFTGELHSIAEQESGLVVAFTGCGPKSAANAKFLIWCAHFILKHRDALIASASGVKS